VVAHRGASDRALENSLAAISLAVADCADMIEFDVRLSADGDAVVLHDARTGRTGRENIVVAESTSERLRRVRLKNGEPIPFLVDVLDLVRGAVPINVHVKTAGGMAAVCGSLADSGYRGRVVLSSGLREECLAARALRPDLPCGLVTVRPSSSDIAFCLRRSLPLLHPDFRRLSLLRVRKVKAAGLLLIPYTVDEPELFFRLVREGAYGVFSNRAESLRKAWRERESSR
jgi:glycerophosphoryl diester phosphodiesterase